MADTTNGSASNYPETTLKPSRPLANKNATLQNNITLSPHHSENEPASDIPHVVLRVFRHTRERTGRKDVEHITSALAIMQVQLLTSTDPPPPSPADLAIFDNRQAGDNVEIYCCAAAVPFIIPVISKLTFTNVDNSTQGHYIILKEGETLPGLPVCGWLPAAFWGIRGQIPLLCSLGSGGQLTTADLVPLSIYGKGTSTMSTS